MPQARKRLKQSSRAALKTMYSDLRAWKVTYGNKISKFLLFRLDLNSKMFYNFKNISRWSQISFLMLRLRKMKALQMKKVKTNFSKKSLFRAQMLHFSLYFCVESTVVGTLTVLWDALHQRGLTRLLPGSNMFLLMTSAYSKKIFEVREGFNFLTAYLACHKP